MKATYINKWKGLFSLLWIAFVFAVIKFVFHGYGLHIKPFWLSLLVLLGGWWGIGVALAIPGLRRGHLVSRCCAALSVCAFAIFVVGVSVSLRSKEWREDLAVRFKEKAYEQWLLEQRPILAGMPKPVIFDYDFTTFKDDPAVLPVITYNLKAGDWDGILELWFILKLDEKGQPIGMREETVTFIRLPAKKTVMSQEGKKRNQYYGLKLNPTDAATAIKRVVAGEDFGDYRKRTEESGHFVSSLFDYNDPWKKLRSK